MPPKAPKPNDFATRVQAYEKARNKGLVFQATGTLGGVTLQKKRKTKRAGRIFSLLLVLLTLIFLKAAIFFYAGPSAYNSKLAPYAASNAAFDHAIMAVMGADPMTIFLAGLMGHVRLNAQGIARAVLPNY